jgi:uncharacterized protein (DUF1501 family)
MNQQHPIKRRQFLERSLLTASGISLGSCLPQSWIKAASTFGRTSAEKILVIVQLSGGNDGLNTIIPVQDPEYKRLRPKLAIAEDKSIGIEKNLSLHPSLKSVAGLLDRNQFAIVQGVGYPSPNRSHFESMDIWHSCETKNKRGKTGWLGRWLDHSTTLNSKNPPSNERSSNNDSIALHLGSEVQPFALTSLQVNVPSLSSIEQFRFQATSDSKTIDSLEAAKMKAEKVASGDSDLLDFVAGSTQSAIAASKRLEEALKQSTNVESFPSTQLGQKLQVIARLIRSGLQTNVYYVTLDGFDTHAQQPAAHASLLSQWSDALGAFVNYLSESGDMDRTLVMTFSEFGRRVAENASEGTDHGAAAPLFLAGTKLQKSIIGDHPKLTDLDDGDLKHQIDFRSVYATILQQWLDCSPDICLGKSYPFIDLFGQQS